MMSLLSVNWIRRAGLAILPAATLLLAAPAAVAGDMFTRDHGGPPEDRGALRICADPNNMPFSGSGGDGFENKMAELFGESMELPVEFFWLPQRFGYIRATLRSWMDEERRYRCDVMMGVPQEASGLTTSTPYYYTTHMFVFKKDHPLFSELEQANDLLVTGIPADTRIGVFDRSPANEWMIRNGMRGNIKGYIMADGDISFYPGKVIEGDLAEGNIDAAIIWGPIAGYYANKVTEETGQEFEMLPMEGDLRAQFAFGVSVGVRAGDHELMRPVQVALREHEDEIKALLDEYHVPQVERPERRRR